MGHARGRSVSRHQLAHEIGLVDDLGDKAGPQQGQQAVAIFGPQEVARTGGQAAVQPVDAIQALDDAGAAAAGAPQSGQVPDAAGEQDRLVRPFGQVETGLDSTRCQTRRQFGLEGGHTAGIGCLGDDADTSHEGIIP